VRDVLRWRDRDIVRLRRSRLALRRHGRIITSMDRGVRHHSRGVGAEAFNFMEAIHQKVRFFRKEETDFLQLRVKNYKIVIKTSSINV
jgi:hypothetical protein